MRPHPSYWAVLTIALITPVTFAQDKTTLSRTTPVVVAVKKTIGGVVAIRVPRPGEKDMIGAGIIVDESGVIITNRHVTGGNKQLKVRLNDGADLTGEVVLTEPDLDLAILQINTTRKLTVLRLGPTNDLMVGETVLAIGSPYGFEATVSRGIISALNREITMPNDVLMTGLIQHDAPINPGNSGGPLVNINGEVIGINVAMRDGAQNIAFTINAGTVQGFLTKYSKRRSGVQHGVKFEEKIVAEVGDRQRVVVKNAAHAELKPGDEIRTVGNLKVANAFDMERSLWNKKPGQQVEIKVNRGGREVTVMVTLESSRGTGSAAVASRSPLGATAGSENSGASVRTSNQR
jgi:serine protease Do